MAAGGLLGKPIGVALLFLLPTVFYTLMVITTGERKVPFELASTGAGLIVASARAEALVFMGLVATAFLSAFLALVLRGYLLGFELCCRELRKFLGVFL